MKSSCISCTKCGYVERGTNDGETGRNSFLKLWFQKEENHNLRVKIKRKVHLACVILLFFCIAF